MANALVCTVLYHTYLALLVNKAKSGQVLRRGVITQREA